jgi:phage terminase large subunit-like protein
VTLLNFDVRFTPESVNSPTRSGCLLWAITGLMHCSKKAPQRRSQKPNNSGLASLLARE